MKSRCNSTAVMSCLDWQAFGVVLAAGERARWMS
jgi:hypothetical protein